MAGCPSMAPTTRSSATSRTAGPSRFDEVPSMIELRRRPSILRRAIVLDCVGGAQRRGAGGRPLTGPEPVGRPVRPGSAARRSAGDPARSHPPRSRPRSARQRTTATRAAPHRRRPSPTTPRVRTSSATGPGPCGVNGLGCFTRTAPTGFTMWLREHGRVVRLGHAALVPDAGGRRRTAATTRRRSPSTSSGTSRSSTTT